MTETETLVRRYYDAFNAGDTEAMLDCLSEDVRHDVNQGPTRLGKPAFAEFCAHMAKCYRETLTDMVFLFDASGTRAAAEFVVNGTYLATDPGLPEAAGQTYRLPAGAFLAVDQGRITRVTTFYNLPEWERQVLG
ncbi:isopropylmalate/homocitrate/citramalate synthase [Paroceanicella profunda]|uniref:Isopropylmalate/homocitrate/citramalate synthase n=1 Tax=Paroceanicella profunda TaxID=2579971 RepID=A0A5B8FVR8_9RHOB|nr:ketosteroid isomerase-related protein [Paroceanicella profunda]QDL90432.1 isopropylmalate/homocitrate/citramalate synthase [Paroceanicella profunda]